MKKQEYKSPTLTVVLLQSAQILSGSRYDNVKTPLNTLDNPEDEITESEKIW